MRHGAARRGRHTPEYRAFVAAKQRCTNPNLPNYKSYGGRGIEFRFKSFEEFFAELGPRPSPQHSLDRFPDNENGHYEKGNVRWATKTEQVCNRRVNPGKSGVPGVLKKAGGFGARLRVCGKRVWLGTFPTIEEASAAYERALTHRISRFAEARLSS